VRGDAPSAVNRATRGVELEDGPVRPSAVSTRSLGGGLHEFVLTISEGRKREVRRLCKALGLTIERLIRVRYGPVELGDLPVGKSRPLSAQERREIERFLSS
jgi:23S rRNA pseudouridine2605 synthase